MNRCSWRLFAIVTVLASLACAGAQADPNESVSYRVVCRTAGAGRVAVEPNTPACAPGQIVTLTAEPNEGWSFARWAGDVNGVGNSVTLTARSDLTAVAIFTPNDPNVPAADRPVGFAGVLYQGLSTTAGGAGGDVVVVTTGQQLRDVLLSRKDSRFNKNYPPLHIVVVGKLTFTGSEMVDVKETYNVSIVGAGTDAVLEGFGLNIYKSYNIIIRNVEFRNCPDDAIDICDPLTHHVWVDHCTLSDAPDVDPGGARHDGLLDIKQGASFVTVSWNHFANHHKTCLLGHSDKNGAEDTGRLKVTYHHNWFDNTLSRHPRVRFGACHVFNNYYDNSRGGMSYGVASTMEADVVVEANYFLQVPHPTYSGYEDSAPGDLVERGNVYVQSGVPQVRGTAFDPTASYTFVAAGAEQVPSLVTVGAGAGKIPVSLAPAAPISKR